MSDNASIYNREPRFIPTHIEAQEIVLPPPPAPKEQHDRNWLVSLLPMAGIGVMSIFYVFRGGAPGSGGNGLIFALPMLILALFTIGGTLIGGRFQQRAVERQRKEAERDYRRMLEDKRAKLEAITRAQFHSLEVLHPSINQLMYRILTEGRPILWERRPEDPDFMYARLGTGTVESKISVKYEEPKPDDIEIDRLMEIADVYRRLKNAPINCGIHRDGSIGFVGSRQLTLGILRSVIVQLCVLHAPDELIIFVLSTRQNASDWLWMENLPHTSMSRRSGSGELVATTEQTVGNLVGVLGQSLDERTDSKSRDGDENPKTTGFQLPQYLVILDGPDLIEAEAIYETLLGTGHRVGASTIALVEERHLVPGLCRAVLEVQSDGQFSYDRVGGINQTYFGQSERLSINDARAIANSMSGFALRETGDAGRIPRRVDFLDMYNLKDIVELSQPNGVLERQWQRLPMKNGLLPFEVPIGRESLTSIIYLALDEDQHGPHGMLAGTTGSGKSEIMQTLVSSLIVEHDPRYLALMLVDFKGGATFGMYRNLPHTVGMITNLSPAMTNRALEALTAEVRDRQLFLDSHGVRNINEYHEYYVTRRGGFSADYRPLPHLCIIIDEFAQLAKQMPAFMTELVNTVQVGRSLGLHLILGTQSPKEVITQEMEDNIQLRMCLRVQSIQASRAMLGRPDAAYIPPGWPGRGFFQVGAAGVFKQFQTAYVGGEYLTPEQKVSTDQPNKEAHILRIDGKTVLESLKETTEIEEQAIPNSNDLRPLTVAEKIVHVVTDFATKYRVPPAKQLLLPPLEAKMTLGRLFEHRSLRHIKVWNGDYHDNGLALGDVPIGITDDIRSRVQDVRYLHFNVSQDENTRKEGEGDGHVLIMGGPSTGKSATMLTIALSVALLYPPNLIHMVAISFTGRSIDLIGELPHANGVISGTEQERVRRLLRRLTNEIEKRQADVGYAKDAPTILFFLDQYEQFNNTYGEDHIVDLEFIVAQGRAQRIFLILSAYAPTVPDRMRSLIRQPIALTLADGTAYLNAIGSMVKPAELDQIPGRALVPYIPPLPLQIAFPSMDIGTMDELNLDSMQALVNHMKAVMPDDVGSDDVLKLDTDIPYRYLQAHAHRARGKELVIPIGKLDDDQLSPFYIDWDEGRHYLIAGPPTSAKTALLRNMILGAAAQHPPEDVRFILVDFQRRSLQPLKSLKHVLDFVINEDDLNHVLDMLEEELLHLKERENRGEIPETFARTIIAIDNYDSMISFIDPYGDLIKKLQKIVQVYDSLQLHVVAAGSFSTSDVFRRQLSYQKSGFSMLTREKLLDVFDIPTRAFKETMPIGRGIFVSTSSQQVVQTAREPADIPAVLHQINNTLWASKPKASWLHIERPSKSGRFQNPPINTRLSTKRASLALPPSPLPESEARYKVEAGTYIDESDVNDLLVMMGLDSLPPEQGEDQMQEVATDDEADVPDGRTDQEISAPKLDSFIDEDDIDDLLSNLGLSPSGDT